MDAGVRSSSIVAPPSATSIGHAAIASAMSIADVEPLDRHLGQRARQHLVVQRRQRGAQRDRRRRRFAQVLADEVRPQERRPAHQRLEQRRAQRIDVRGGADGRVADLLGRHVRQRPQEAARLRLPEVDQVSAAEVAQLRVAGGVEEDVGRLDVAMHDAALVRRAQRGQQVQRQAPARGGRQRAVRRPAGRPAYRRTSARTRTARTPAARRTAPRCWGGGAGPAASASRAKRT